MNGVELGAIMFEGGQARMWFDGEKYLPAFSASLGYAAGPWPMSPLPTVPLGISPVNGSGDVVPPAVALVWSKCVPGVLQYRVEVAADSVFQFVLLDSLVSDTVCTLSSLETLHSYWWRVRARNDEGWGGACHPMSFRTIEVGVEDDGTQPHQVSLRQNYPNPFNPVTTITYQLPGAAEVRLSVHDMLGREVRLLVRGRIPAGTHTVEFNGAGLASGAYAYRLSVRIPGPVGGKGSGTGIGTQVQSRTMLLLR